MLDATRLHDQKKVVDRPTWDTAVVEGVFVPEADLGGQHLGIVDGTFVHAAAPLEAWRTINASGGVVMPGAIQPVSSLRVNLKRLCEAGVTCLLVDVGPLEKLDGSTSFKSPLDLILMPGIGPATRASEIVAARARGVRTFGATGSHVTGEVHSRLGSATVRVNVRNPTLTAWIRAAVVHDFKVVVWGVDSQTYPGLVDAGHARSPNVELETTASALVVDRGPLWAGVKDHGISMVLSDHDVGPTALEVLCGPGTRVHGLSSSDVVRLLCVTPAQAWGVSREKGSLRPAADSDLVVFDADQSGRPEAGAHEGRVNLVMLGGRVLYMQDQVHPPTSGGRIVQASAAR